VLGEVGVVLGVERRERKIAGAAAGGDPAPVQPVYVEAERLVEMARQYP
jgi:hypothetical protein